MSDAALTEEYGYKPRWFTQSGLLGYTTDRYQTFFSTGPTSSLPSDEGAEISQVDLPELLDRADAAALSITELVIESAAGGQIEHTAPPNSSFGHAEILEDLRGALGRRSAVKAVAVALGGGSRHLWCDLTKRTASGRTKATFPLSDFMASAIPMLRSLRSGEYGEISGLVENLDLAEIEIRVTDEESED
ncbi:hypothetical protein [Streptomyces zhihengii]|uniref:hypothetical protein n=1 Tax=Streptomyces zhihengii TaxID=1818004 RepID=UPI0033AD15F2